ncbi:hypothetical protein DEO72_LG9g1856 [Vigna unguiculata]|uniref:Uncharacterized protein n=1 Tax=Vigna unguiculata TaxID=3917 RepID=A0A4D6N1J1_VIGUN|nr:hypothetical protein DEO72_LG9g1856 [Vigna unguiculata]
MSASSRIASHSTRVARRKRLPDRLAGDTCCQAPSASDAIVSTSIAWRTTLIARHNTLQFSIGFVAIGWRSNTTAKRYTNTCVILVFKHLKQGPPLAAKHHRLHLHQHPLLTCTAYTIIAKHKQIG